MSVEGTPEELRQKAHEAAALHAGQFMPLAERLAVTHLLGHAVENATEDAAQHPGRRYRLEGYGHEDPGFAGHHITLTALLDAPETPTT